MEDILVMILQLLVEVVAEILLNLPFSWAVPTVEVDNLNARALINLVLFWTGCGLAWLSLFFVNRTFIHLPELRIANLFLAPVAAAFIAQYVARRRWETNDRIVPRAHFWRAFWFTAGLVAVRFAFVTR